MGGSFVEEERGRRAGPGGGPDGEVSSLEVHMATDYCQYKERLMFELGEVWWEESDLRAFWSSSERLTLV